jgi:hypothetical protein
MSRPIRRLVTVSTVSLLFVGGAAAAATGSSSLSPLLGGSDDSGPQATIHVTTTSAPTSTAATADSIAAASVESDVSCETAKNHGAAVSSVAHDEELVGAPHGAAVSEMAQTDCGKTEDDDEIEADSEPADETTDDDICATAKNHGQAVSSVAHDEELVGAAHGAAVSEMAQTDCGKKQESETEEESAESHRNGKGSAKKHAHNDNDEAPQGS